MNEIWFDNETLLENFPKELDVFLWFQRVKALRKTRKRSAWFFCTTTKKWVLRATKELSRDSQSRSFGGVWKHWCSRIMTTSPAQEAWKTCWTLVSPILTIYLRTLPTTCTRTTLRNTRPIWSPSWTKVFISSLSVDWFVCIWNYLKFELTLIWPTFNYAVQKSRLLFFIFLRKWKLIFNVFR